MHIGEKLIVLKETPAHCSYTRGDIIESVDQINGSDPSGLPQTVSKLEMTKT